MKRLLLLALPLLHGCAGVTAESSFHDKALTRAAFELSCPAEKLQISVLERHDGLGCAGSQVGVEGCGKKAIYVCSRSQEWINNTGAAPAH